MQPDLHARFAAQAAWQRTRARLTWPEKIRLAKVMRDSVRQLRRAPAQQGDRAVRRAHTDWTEK